ncbi:hypothetical protein [Lichenifustis flavocetrariae]|uniref:Uncharacterized protein n=1 Tax=Lichenifustis flavocetrariae TaxID=2949735 RepID=A0AA41YUU3_9HYPH|nr:hypothetical protein [Lichenifustis flavocetrariae]MCW6507740.1 hypothetical protein [Lichenifustis flavocetrariae]
MFNILRRSRRNAILYLSHRLDKDALAGWNQLKEDCIATDTKPFFLYDNTRSDFSDHPNIKDSEIYLFSFSHLAQHWPFKAWDAARPLDQGNIIFVILNFWKDNPGYQFYWRVEFDVFLDAQWCDLIAAFKGNKSGLLTTTLVRPETRPGWVWWETLKSPETLRRSVEPIRSFMPLARLSGEACEVLSHAYRSGWAGHDEVSVPTILHHEGLMIEDLGGIGEFVGPSSSRQWYTNTPTLEGLGPGTFVCPPKQADFHQERGKLYHPVKDRGSFLAKLKETRLQAP